MYFRLLLLLVVCVMTYTAFGFRPMSSSLSRKVKAKGLILNQRVAKNNKEDETQMQKVELGEDEMIVPYTGLVGNEEGRVFNKPLQTFDPMDNTDDLPGEDGSDTKINAIQARIQARVEELKSAGQWEEDGDDFGMDPLRFQPLVVTMGEQVKVCKPFESISDLTLTYLLVLITTLALGSYLIALREGLDSFIGWYEASDFDAFTSAVNALR